MRPKATFPPVSEGREDTSSSREIKLDLLASDIYLGDPLRGTLEIEDRNISRSGWNTENNG